MKTRTLTVAALALLACVGLTACSGAGNKNENKNENMTKQENIQEVAGRKNFGNKHALVTTPQPCVMIATWDKDHTPDVMMAAWAGQLDYAQIVISLSKHKTSAM